MTEKHDTIFSLSPATVAGWLIACFLVNGPCASLQAQVAPAGFTVTDAFASTVVMTLDYKTYINEVKNATRGTLRQENVHPANGKNDIEPNIWYNGTLTLPEAKNGQSWICLMTLVSDDGCTMSIDDRPKGALPEVKPWLEKYGIANDISKGANAWQGLRMKK